MLRPWISRVVIPRAYIEMILSSKPVQRATTKIWPGLTKWIGTVSGGRLPQWVVNFRRAQLSA